MTEDEAKTKRCPFVRLAKARGAEVPHGQTVFNRLETGEHVWAMAEAATCIASACMAWRQTKDEALGWHSEERELNEERHGKHIPGGYCGLAGASS